MTLGTYPKVSAPKARDAATKVLAAAALGADPVGERKAKRQGLTVAQLLELYEEEGCFVQRGLRQGQPMKATTKAYTLARLKHHVLPLLGTKRAEDLTEADIERFVRDVTAGKTAKDEKVARRRRIVVKGGPGAARKVVRDLSAMLSFAKRLRVISSNPVSSASICRTDNRRERHLTHEEVQRLAAALDELDRNGTNQKATNIVRLLALTGARRNEVAGLLWTEVELEKGRLVLGESKTGKSVRPLGQGALALLKQLRDAAPPNAIFVFPAERGDGFYQGTKRAFSQALAKASLPGVTLHTLRHTVGATAASAGEGLLLVGSLLGHANARSTSIYAHVSLGPARRAADRATLGIAAAFGLQVAAEGASAMHPVK